MSTEAEIRVMEPRGGKCQHHRKLQQMAVDPLQEPPEGQGPARPLIDFCPEILILDFWLPGLGENTFLLF